MLPYRKLDDAAGPTEVAGDVLTDIRRGKNGRYGLAGQFRQSVFGRLGGYDGVNDADRLGLNPVMGWIVGGHAVTKQAASTSRMGRFHVSFSYQAGSWDRKRRVAAKVSVGRHHTHLNSYIKERGQS